MFENDETEVCPSCPHYNISSSSFSHKLTMTTRRTRGRERLFINKHQETQRTPKESHTTHSKHSPHAQQVSMLKMLRKPEQRIQSIGSKPTAAAAASKSSNPRPRGQRVTNPIVINDKIRTSTAPLLVALCCWLTIMGPQIGLGRQLSLSPSLSTETKANLPTVIVRGFLNYRTTVDGTVLLFTPDAGSGSGSSSAVHIQPSSRAFVVPTASISSSMAINQPPPPPHVGSAHDQIEPARPPPAFMAPFESASDAWRPVQATPPLRQAPQTVVLGQAQAQQQVQPAATRDPQQGAQSSSWPTERQGFASPAVGATERELEGLAPTGSTEPAENAARSRRPTGSSPTPSVQSDDIINAGNGEQLQQGTTFRSLDLAPGNRASRPRRPSLGFNGQAIRAGGQRPDRPKAQTGNQNEAQTHNTINGIRRPGLSTTPVPPATTSDNQQDQQQPRNNPSRSSVAGSKLRNRFKRPPPTSGLPVNPAAASTTPSNSFIEAITSSPPHTTMSPPPVVPPVSNVSPSTTSLQLAESGDVPFVGPQLKLSDPQPPEVGVTVEVAAESAPLQDGAAVQKPSQAPTGSELETRSTGDQAALQARLGDLFGSSPATATGGSLSGSAAVNPAVGSDEVLISPDVSGNESASSSPSAPPEEDHRKLISRSGDQPPSPDIQHDSHVLSGGLAGGELQQGQLGNAPLSLDAFFQGDQPQPESSEHRVHHQHGHSHHQAKEGSNIGLLAKKNHNERLTGWLDHHHHNKHIPRPSKPHHHDHEAGHLSQQLAANLNSLSPSFASNMPNSLKPTPVHQAPAVHQQPSSALQDLGQNHTLLTAAINTGNNATGANETAPATESLQMQTLTQTYSTVMTTTRTRLVPLQVKSTTAVHTIIENYIITKVLTAYQTMPVGEFILPEVHSTRSPFDMFSETPVAPTGDDKSREQPISAPSNFVPSAAPSQPAVQQPSGAGEMQEQPISLDPNAGAPKIPDWLQDFNNNNSNNQNQQLAALLEQQAQEQNLAGLAGLGGALNEPLDQLASSLDPASLLTQNGQIQLPDLNNPIVLAAAIQNPQLAAVILAAQQLQLKQRANKLAATGQGHQLQHQHQLLPAALQPSYSTTFSTQVRPSTYTVRDTMFTTRLVSFKDGRTVRTRTVSEPGSVIEQVLTTTVTETIPVTLTIRPTGMLTLPGTGHLATVAPQQQQVVAASNQATINNALIATQLAQLLSRRQQQVQPSGLAALQQLLASQQHQQRANQQQQQQQSKQFQPNFQNLLQSLQQQQQQASNLSPSSTSSPAESPSQQQQSRNNQPQPATASDKLAAQPTPPLAPLVPNQPFVTTLTNLQVKTYTVHNAFQTHFRTITSTQLITSTIYPPGMTRSSTMASG